MIKYFIGWFLNIFNPAVSIFSFVDNKSVISNKSRIWRKAKIYRSSVGDYSYVAPNTNIVFAHIGKFCSIAGNCSIGMGKHPLNQLSTSSIFIAKRNATCHSWTDLDSYHEYDRVQIGNDVWIGKNVMVMGGVTIGNGAVIGAGSIVTKDIPPYAIAVGVPAKVVKHRFDQDLIDKLLDLQWWELPDNILKENISYFQKPNISLKEISSFL